VLRECASERIAAPLGMTAPLSVVSDFAFAGAESAASVASMSRVRHVLTDSALERPEVGSYRLSISRNQILR